MKSGKNIIVVGGGLSGLTLAYLLSKQGMVVTVLEASSRLGGRIQTIEGSLGAPLELGATWMSDLHENLLELITELGLIKYPQYAKGLSVFQMKSFVPFQKFHIPEAEPSVYRIAGGTQRLIDALVQFQPSSDIHLNTRVTKVRETEAGISVQTAEGKEWYADNVMMCIPLQLASQILYTSGLPDELTAILPYVQTWLAGTFKFVVEYDNPFWRKEGYSGTFFSHAEAGLITEMYDHTNFEQNKYGFTGFLSPGAAAFSYEIRRESVGNQLVGLFGDGAAKIATYDDKLWSDNYLLSGDAVIRHPRQYIGNPLLRQPYMNGKLHFCGTETSSEYGGYMEGAIIAAKRAARIF